MQLAIFVIALSSGFIIALAWYAIEISNKFTLKIIPEAKLVIPVFILIFSILAYRGILKDDRLIKSNDRLR